MEPTESNHFPRFERQEFISLDRWRRELVGYRDKILEEMRTRAHEDPATFYTPGTEEYEALINNMLARQVEAEAARIDPLVLPGDLIIASGEVYYELYGEGSGSYGYELLSDGAQLQGTVSEYVIQAYYDETVLDFFKNTTVDGDISDYIRYYGIYMGLTHPILLTSSGARKELTGYDTVLIPLHYNSLHLHWYPLS